MVVVGVLLTSFVLRMRETGRFQTLLTLTAGPASGHTVVEEPCRAVPVGTWRCIAKTGGCFNNYFSVKIKIKKKTHFVLHRGLGADPGLPGGICSGP